MTGPDVGHVSVGVGGRRAVIVVQSMTMTDTADAAHRDGPAVRRACGKPVRRWCAVTVNVPTRPRRRCPRSSSGCSTPGCTGAAHRRLPLQRSPAAHALSRLRARARQVPYQPRQRRHRPKRRDEQFSTICQVAIDHGKPVRIGVNGGSLNQELVMAKMQENTDRGLGRESDDIINECMVLSALQSTELALETGLTEHQIIISCKVSRPRTSSTSIARWRSGPAAAAPGADRGRHGHQGPGVVGVAIGILLQRRHRRHHPRVADAASRRRPARGGVRRLRDPAGARPAQFAPSVTACPGCGRTTSTTFQELAEAVQGYIREQMPAWKQRYDGVETSRWR
jgi:(E)-4-hydroxy-3-methylbut-2-enyl-diphosphate synthase